MIIEGDLYSWFETGCEGQIWTLLADEPRGEVLKGCSDEETNRFYARMVILDSHVGKDLTIYKPGSQDILWSGKIDPDRETGYQEYPLNPGNGQPCAYGLWVHWTQRGFTCEGWADFFFTWPDPTEEEIKELEIIFPDKEIKAKKKYSFPLRASLEIS